MKNKFEKEETNSLLNPVDWFNFYGSFVSIFENIKDCNIKSEIEVCMYNPKNPDSKDLNEPTFVLKNGLVECKKINDYDIPKGQKLSKFMLLSAVKFKGDYFSAMSYVSYQLQKNDIPYIRVGVDYFKVIKKKDRYGSEAEILKAWKKDEIKQDHSKQLLSYIFKFDDFCLIPDNTNYQPVNNNCYNLYSKFMHEPFQSDVKINDISNTMEVLNHIFGEQMILGLQYLKVLFEYPKQILPVLVLVSTERETGKTTFLNWISMIFGNNSVLISPDELTHSFNSSYATKNIIMVDETIIEKSTSVEKLKSLATAKSISVQQKFVSSYSIPFYGKVIICTNKEKDFMKIDEEEIRFWIRKIKPITGQKNTNIESDLYNEIPKFLKYLESMNDVDFSRSRMVFTADQIKTNSLQSVKEESKSSIRKDIEYLIDDVFYNNNDLNEFLATPKDIKDVWFSKNSNISISYISKVLREEMKLQPEKNQRYNKFGENELNKQIGTPYKFIRNVQKLDSQIVNKIDDVYPF
jgi:hypothetical protein